MFSCVDVKLPALCRNMGETEKQNEATEERNGRTKLRNSEFLATVSTLLSAQLSGMEQQMDQRYW